jgi:hypothetical protein
MLKKETSFLGLICAKYKFYSVGSRARKVSVKKHSAFPLSKKSVPAKKQCFSVLSYFQMKPFFKWSW